MKQETNVVFNGGGGTCLSAPASHSEGVSPKESSLCIKLKPGLRRLKPRNDIFAFTLAEMMVVMLILSIVMAAFAPVMTTRSKSDRTSPWRYSSDNTNIYYGLGENQTAMIGQPSKVNGTDPSTRLIISTSDDNQKHIVFKRGANSMQGILRLNRGSIFLGSPASEGAVTNSVVLGVNTIAKGDEAIVIGKDAESSEGYSISIGTGSITAGDSIAIGKASKATTRYATAVGGETPIGHSSQALGDYSAAFGNASQALGNVSTAVGAETLANSNYSTAVGSNAIANAENTTAIGYDSKASGNYSTALGRTSLASAENAIAIGHASKTTGINSTALGGTSLASAKNAIAIGHASKTTGINSLALGASSQVTGGYAVAVGYDAKAEDDNTVSLGYNNIAKNKGSVAIGSNSTSSGLSSIAIGSYGMYTDTKALGNYSIALGYEAQAQGQNNIAIGNSACKYATGSNKICIGANSGPREGDIQATDDVERIYIGSRGVFQPPEYTSGHGGGVAAVTYHAPLEIHKNGNESTIILNSNLIVRGNIFFLARKYDRFGAVYQTFGSDDINIDAGVSEPLVSDRRLKYVNSEITSGLDKIKQLKVFNYTFKNDKKKTPHVGVIAQDLQKVFPDAVKKGDNGFLEIRMEDMFYAVVNSIKELAFMMDKNEQKIIQLEQENKDLKSRLERLEAKLK